MSETSVRISEAVTPEERDAAFQLRYQVFVDELGYRVPGADATRRIVDPEDEHAFVMIGRAGEAIAATAAVDWWGRTELAPAKVANYQLQPFADAFGRRSVCIFRKGVVARPYRKSPLFGGMVHRACAFMCAQPGARFGFVEASPYLVTLYERIGFVRYAPHFAYADSGALAVPLCFVMNDHEHLARVGSPMLEVVRKHGHGHDPEVQRFFRERWGAAAPRPATVDPADVALDPHAEVNRALALGEIPLFENIDADRASAFLASCRVVRLAPKDVLIEASDAGTDLYLLTRGYVDVTRETDGRRIAVATRGPGDLLGESSMLLGTGRTTTVTALTDVDAVVIPERVFHEGNGDPAVLARISLNLARILARRLRASDGLITTPPPL